MSESPADTLRRAASLLRMHSNEATPGPWERPLNTRNKAEVTAPLPGGERGSYTSGIDPSTGKRERCAVVLASSWSNGAHVRKRSGRDLEYIAAIHPGVGLYFAEMLAHVADDMADADVTEAEDGTLLVERHPAYRPDWVAALNAARTYLKENRSDD